MFLLDMDGVCYDILSAIKIRNKRFNPNGVEKYNFSGNIGISREEVFRYLKEPKTFELEKLYEGVEVGIRKLKQVTDVIAYTSVPDSCYDIRFRQITNLGLVGHVFNADKPVISYCTGILDDNPAELDKYLGTGAKLFLQDRVYNQVENNPEYDFSKYIRVNSIEEVVEYLR